MLAAAVGFAAVGLWESAFARTLPVPLMASVTLFLLALAIFVWALMIRPRLRRKEGTKPISPFTAARTAAFAMAASRTGALVAGFYLGTALAFAAKLYIPIAKERLWLALAAAAAAVLVVLASLWLEHICRLPGDDDENGSQSSTQDDEPTDWAMPRHER
jgi:hypothetical protein